MSTGMPNDNGQGAEQATNAGEQLAYNPTPPEAVENPNPVITAFRDRGYDTTAFNDDQQFIQTLESGLSQLSEIPQLKEQLQNQTRAASEMMPSDTPVDPSGYQSYDETGDWNPPEYDERWENLVTVDPDSGQYVPINEHVNPAVAQRANEYRSWLKDQGKTFWRNPYDFMKDGLQGWVQGMVEDGVNNALYQNNVDNNVDGFLTQNRQRFYVTDQNGHIQTNPDTGEELLTAQGQSLKFHAEAARNLGIADANSIQAYAINMLERDLYANQVNQQQYAQQQPQPQQQQQTFLQEAANPGQENWSPNRDASMQTAAEGGMAQNSGLSFFDMAMPEMVNMGLVQQTG